MIRVLGRRFYVLRLDLFGSAAREVAFDPGCSDLGFLVAYNPRQHPSIHEHPTLRDALAGISGNRVDLVMEGAVPNPFVRARIERSRQRFYSA